jgi:hypothetical protein
MLKKSYISIYYTVILRRGKSCLPPLDGSNSLQYPRSKTPNASKECPTSQDAPNESAALLAKAEQMAHLGS